MSDNFIYNEETREHYLGSLRIKSVTQILTEAGRIDTRFYAPGSGERGSEIHQQCADVFYGTIPQTPHEKVLSYLNWREMAKDYEVIAVEQPMCSLRHKYCGKIDILATDAKGKVCVIDIKSGAAENWHELQLGAYSQMVKEAQSLTYRPDGYCLYLKTKGRFTFIKMNTRDGFAQFIQALEVAR